MDGYDNVVMLIMAIRGYLHRNPLDSVSTRSSKRLHGVVAGSGGTENHLEMSGDESEQSMTRDITTYEELVHSSIPHVVAWPTGAHCSNLHLYTATGLIECCVEQHMQVQEALAKPGGMKYRNTIMSNFDVCGLFSEKNLSTDCR